MQSVPIKCTCILKPWKVKAATEIITCLTFEDIILINDSQDVSGTNEFMYNILSSSYNGHFIIK